MTRSTYKAALATAATTAVAGVIVVIGAAFTKVAGGGTANRIAPPSGLPVPPVSLIVVAWAIIGISVAAAGAWLVWSLLHEPRARAAVRNTNYLRVIAIALVVIVGFGVFYLSAAFVLSLIQTDDEMEEGMTLDDLNREEDEEQVDDLEDEPDEPDRDREAAGSGPGRRAIMLALAALFVSTAVVLAVWASRKYGSRPDAADRTALDELHTDLQSVSATALDRMLDEPDHRLAVIAAYALVERTLERNGFPHASSQTPMEFMLATVARIEDVKNTRNARRTFVHREDLLELTGLYEIAKFSEHPVGTQERRAAVACLDRIRTGITPDGGERTEYRHP